MSGLSEFMREHWKAVGAFITGVVLIPFTIAYCQDVRAVKSQQQNTIDSYHAEWRLMLSERQQAEGSGPDAEAARRRIADHFRAVLDAVTLDRITPEQVACTYSGRLAYWGRKFSEWPLCETDECRNRGDDLHPLGEALLNIRREARRNDAVCLQQVSDSVDPAASAVESIADVVESDNSETDDVETGDGAPSGLNDGVLRPVD